MSGIDPNRRERNRVFGKREVRTVRIDQFPGGSPINGLDMALNPAAIEKEPALNPFQRVDGDLLIGPVVDFDQDDPLRCIDRNDLRENPDIKRPLFFPFCHASLNLDTGLCGDCNRDHDLQKYFDDGEDHFRSSPCGFCTWWRRPRRGWWTAPGPICLILSESQGACALDRFIHNVTGENSMPSDDIRHLIAVAVRSGLRAQIHAERGNRQTAEQHHETFERVTDDLCESTIDAIRERKSELAR